ncbi:MAG TPA: GNAT family N-acetyltransferase [Streptosporangiaceae bacterium]|nr:GNAT family N-acetyltransferase [Streptosporangiaceae bacterium]
MTDVGADRSAPGLSWRRLTACDLPGLTRLYARALERDGGSAFADDELLLRRWFIDGVEDSLAVLDADRLIGACAWRYVSSGGERCAVVVGQVDPDERRRGIGGRLLDFALDGAGAGVTVRVETESGCGGADALYRSRGLVCVFAEDLMTCQLADGLPVATMRADVVYTEWSASVAERFFAVYEAAFIDRPGFPAWSATEWIKWISDDDDFRADWTLLASVAGADVGFVAGADGGWIVQVGVVPAARRQAVASALIVEVLRRMLADGQTQAMLHVNVNNPGAIATYGQLGFLHTGRRARYEPPRLAAPWQPR